MPDPSLLCRFHPYNSPLPSGGTDLRPAPRGLRNEATCLSATQSKPDHIVALSSGINSQTLRIVDIPVASQASIDTLPQHGQHGVSPILALTRVGQHGTSLFRQTECLIQFTKRKQARVARDLHSMEFELELAIKLNTKCLSSPVTHWMPLSKCPETLESHGKHARIMPSRARHLENPGSIT
jgi:hypothetical protein